MLLYAVNCIAAKKGLVIHIWTLRYTRKLPTKTVNPGIVLSLRHAIGTPKLLALLVRLCLLLIAASVCMYVCK